MVMIKKNVCEIHLYRLILGCNAAKKNKQDKTKPIKPNNP